MRFTPLPAVCAVLLLPPATATRTPPPPLLASRTLPEPEGSLTINLVPEAGQPTTGYADLRGVLRIKWGSTELSTGWRIDPFTEASR